MDRELQICDLHRTKCFQQQLPETDSGGGKEIVSMGEHDVVAWAMMVSPMEAIGSARKDAGGWCWIAGEP